MNVMLNTTQIYKFIFSTLVLFILFAQLSCSPQTDKKKATEKCEIELKDLPPFRGLKIGMPLKLKPSKLPDKYQTDSNPNKGQEIDNVQELGYTRRTLYINASRNEVANIGLSDTIDTYRLQQVDLATFDGNLVEFRVEYDGESPWLEYTAQTTADELKLPRGSFEFQGISSTCFCKDFIVSILNLSSGVVITIDPYESTFSNKNISKILIERDKERTLKKQNTFTP
jgi:hypothetical protein